MWWISRGIVYRLAPRGFTLPYICFIFCISVVHVYGKQIVTRGRLLLFCTCILKFETNTRNKENMSKIGGPLPLNDTILHTKRV